MKLEVAILRGNSTDREILLSLGTLIEWKLVHPYFPNVTLDKYIFNKRKENKTKYSALYSRQSEQNSHVKIREQVENFALDDPSPECQKLQNKLLVKFKDCFKEKLSPQDRIKVPDIRIVLDPSKKFPRIISAKHLTQS